jgi:hypothetical protein
VKKIDNSTLEVDGRFYMYDYDSDCYLRISEPRTETFRERMIKIVAAVVGLMIIMVSTKYYF